MERLCPDVEPRRNPDGFTLIEVLVALTILSIALTVLLGIFGQSLARSRESAARMEARDLALSLLSQPASTLDYETRAGHAPPDLEWRLDIRPYGSEQDRDAWPGAAARLTARVTWGARDSGQFLSLSTLAILPREHQR